MNPLRNQDKGMGTKESDSSVPILLPFRPFAERLNLKSAGKSRSTG